MLGIILPIWLSLPIYLNELGCQITVPMYRDPLKFGSFPASFTVYFKQYEKTEMPHRASKPRPLSRCRTRQPLCRHYDDPDDSVVLTQSRRSNQLLSIILFQKTLLIFIDDDDDDDDV